MIKSKGIFAVSFIAMMVAGGAYANIASQGYVDQQVDAKQNASTAVKVATAGTAVGDATHPIYVNASGVATKIDKVAAAASADTATSATKATQDASGNVITTTYATKTELNAKADADDIPTVNNATLTIQKNGTAVATFTANSATAATANITVPTKTSELSNDSGFITSADLPDEITVDAALSADSTNPVQNKVVKAALDKKLENTATGTGSLSTGGATPATAVNTVVIGDAASGLDASVVVGKSAKSSETGVMSVAVGANASANDRETVAIGANANVAGHGVAIGARAKTTVDYGTAVGFSAEAGAGSAVAIGQGAKSTALGAIQLGTGTNSTEGTFNVGFGTDKTYQLLDNNGKIPDERMPDTVLTNTATGTGSFATGGGDAGTYQGAVVTGLDASASGNAATVYGPLASAGDLGTAVGNGATAADTSVAVGSGSDASGATSTAVGGAAEATGERSIQLGQGTNSEPKTFSVGLGDTTSENYTLLKADGTIPAERMPDTVLTNTATGTDSFAVGNNSGALGQNSVAVGVDAKGEGANSVVVGNEAGAGGNDSISLGFGASTNAQNAIQIGTGTNLDSGTLSVGFGDSGNYKLLDSSGKIPGERLQISVGSATSPTGYADIWIE